MGKLTALRGGADRGMVVHQYGERRMVLNEVGAVVTVEMNDGYHTSSLRLRPGEVDFLRDYLNDAF